MSKVVKSVGRVFSKVVGGIGRLAEKITGSKTIGKLARFAAIAAAVYFGGAAIAGMSSGAGAMAGLQGAWTSLGTAGSAVMAGNFAGAGSALSAGIGGAGMTGAQLAASQAAGAAGATAGAAGAAAAPANYGLTTGSQLVGTGSGIAAVPAASAVPSMALPTAAKASAGLLANPYVAPALISAGGGMLGSVAQGRAQQEAEQRQERLAGEERERYNRNIGTRVWG